MASSAVDCHSSQRPQIRCWRSHREADTLAVVVAVAVVVPANKRRRRLLGTPWAENAFSRVAAGSDDTPNLSLRARSTRPNASIQVKSSQVKQSVLEPAMSPAFSPRILSAPTVPCASCCACDAAVQHTHDEVIIHKLCSLQVQAPGPCPGRIPLALPLASPQMVRQSSCTGTVEDSRSELMARAPV